MSTSTNTAPLPMLCKTVDVVPLDAEAWAMEAKLDGWRAIIEIAGGKARLWGGRNGNEYSGQLPYLEDELVRLVPDDSILDGELIATPTGGFGQVQGVMTAGTPMRAALVPIKFVAFDLLRSMGHDMRKHPWSLRRATLELIYEETDERAFEHSLLSPAVDPSQEVADALVAQGYEGVVCKRRGAPYSHGRSPNWIKFKPQLTCEAVITGMKPGKAGGKFDGMVGAFEIRLLDNDATTTVKCGVDANHRDATDHPERWVGKVIEIEHHGLGTSGVPRHPMFLRRRDDRDATIEQKPRTAPAASPQRDLTGKPSGRNYNAMGDAKLLGCVKQLRAGSGDAVNRVEAKGASVAADLELAEAAARAKGLIA